MKDESVDSKEEEDKPQSDNENIINLEESSNEGKTSPKLSKT